MLRSLKNLIDFCPHAQLSDSSSVFPNNSTTTPLPLIVVNNDYCRADNHLGFVCLERGNAADNSLCLASGEQHCAQVTIAAGHV